jgi:transposase
LRGLVAIVRDESDTRLPDLSRRVLQVLASQLEQLAVGFAAVEKQLAAWHRSNAVSQRLASIPGIGPIIATALAATVVEPIGFASVASSQHGWVWGRGSTRPVAKRAWAASPSAATATCGVC